MDSPEIMLKPLLAADCMPKKVHRVFHEKVTGLGKIHKYQPKNWSLETTHVETLGCHLILPSKARLHSHFSGWSTEHHLPNSEISGDKQSKLEGNRRKMEEGKGTPGSYLHTDSFTSFKISSSLPEVSSRTSVMLNLKWGGPKGHIVRLTS